MGSALKEDIVIFDSDDNKKSKRRKNDDDLWNQRNWKQIIGRFFVFLGAACLVLAVTLMLMVEGSPSFRQGILANFERSFYDSTGARVSARDFTMGFFPPKVDLYAVVIHGSEPQFSQPLLYADHVGAELKLSSLRYRRWNLRALVVDHPVVHYSVTPEGESNLPQPAKSARNTTHILDLAIENAVIRGGEVDRNDDGTKTTFEADLHRVRLAADFEGAAKSYRSLLRYGQGTIKAGSYALLDHALDSDFEITPAKLTVSNLHLTAGKFRLSLTGSVEGYNHPAVQANFDAQMETSDIEPVLKKTLPAAGVLRIAGTLHYRRDPGRPLLETVSVNGTVSSPALAVTAGGLRAQVLDVGARYKLAGGNAEFENIHASVFGGSLTGSLSIHDLGGPAHAVLEARLKNASLEQIQSADPRNVSPDARLSGAIQADLEVTCSKSLEDLVARGNASVQGALGRNPSTPLRAVIRAEYTAAGRQLSLHQSYIKTAQTSLTMDGSASEKSQLQMSLHSGNLHELELLAENFRAAPASQPLEKLDLYGTATFTAFVTDSAGGPQLKGQLEARNLRVKGTSWKLLRTDIEASPSSLTFSNGNLEAAFPEPNGVHDSPGSTHAGISGLLFKGIGELADANVRRRDSGR